MGSVKNKIGRMFCSANLFRLILFSADICLERTALRPKQNRPKTISVENKSDEKFFGRNFARPKKSWPICFRWTTKSAKINFGQKRNIRLKTCRKQFWPEIIPAEQKFGRFAFRPNFCFCR